MLAYWVDPIDTCPPTVVLCRVAYRLICSSYKVNPLQFEIAHRGIATLAADTYMAGFVGLGASLMDAADFLHRRKGKLELWRFDACRRAGKARTRALDPRWRAYEEGYPRITNRGVASVCSWLEDLPDDLPDARTAEGRARL
jgi:hypothetical protein